MPEIPDKIGQPCAICGQNAVYADRLTGRAICFAHARLEVHAADNTPPGKDAPPLTIRLATPTERETVGLINYYLWEETEDICFGRLYNVLALPALVAVNEDDEVVGLLSISVDRDDDALTLVSLGVLPGYQGRGTGWDLLAAAEVEARRLGLGWLRLETTNDNLPALYLYQRAGFTISGIIYGAGLEHHAGVEEMGFAGIPVRDVIQLGRRLR
jgi:ribosomal protein S18 acetylase RimI-like enzyme